jgi:hypothetical protein
MKMFPSRYLAPEGGAAASADNTNKQDDKGGAEANAQLHAGIEKARTEERAKLRGEISVKDAEILALKTKQTELETKVTQLTASLDALNAAKSTDGSTVDVPKLIEEVSAKFTKIAAGEAAGTQNRVQQLEAQLEAMRLKETRNRLIQEAGGEDNLIVGLVKGTNEDEIRASVQEAKAAFEKVTARFKKGAQQNADQGDDNQGDGNDSNNSRNDTNADQVPPDVNDAAAGASAAGGGGAGRGKDATVLGKVHKMAPKDYATNREQVLTQMRKRYQPNSNNPVLR